MREPVTRIALLVVLAAVPACGSDCEAPPSWPSPAGQPTVDVSGLLPCDAPRADACSQLHRHLVVAPGQPPIALRPCTGAPGVVECVGDEACMRVHLREGDVLGCVRHSTLSATFACADSGGYPMVGSAGRWPVQREVLCRNDVFVACYEVPGDGGAVAAFCFPDGEADASARCDRALRGRGGDR
jgi:hypothetical protein